MAFYKTKFELSPRLKFGVKRGVSHNQKFKIFTVLFLSIAAILGINAIRLVLKNTPSGNTSQPQVLGATDSKENTNSIEFMEYKVQKGDTLFNISQKYNINWATLATLNNLKSPFVLKLGQIIKIPK
jgi:LysM repeat protein